MVCASSRHGVGVSGIHAPGQLPVERIEADARAVAQAGAVLTPAPFNVRTRVHEYGGGAYAADGDTVWFSNFADNLVHVQQGDAAPVAITADGTQRHADLELDARHQRLIAIREQHGEGEPRNSIVALKLDGSRAERLTSTPEREESPTFSPDGKWVATASTDPSPRGMSSASRSFPETWART